MDSQTITLTLPFNAQQFWVFTIALSLMALSGGIALFSGKRVAKDRLPKDWLRNSLLIAGGLLAPIWAALLFMVLTGLWHLAWEMPKAISAGNASLRWHTLAIVGLITTFVGILGAPLAMIRVVMTERQTRATEEGLVTDRINKAVEGLGAVREVKEGEDTTTKPNLEVRLGALYSLQRIAEDSPRDRGQILDMLCAYIRENARAEDAEPSFYATYRKLSNGTASEAPMSDHQIVDYLNHRGDPADLLSEPATLSWIEDLQRPRSDISASLTILCNTLSLCRREDTEVTFSKDLSGTNLRKAVLEGFEFSEWDFSKSYLDGSTIKNCTFYDCNLSNSYWIGVDLSVTHLNGCKLSNTHFFRTRFSHQSQFELTSDCDYGQTSISHCSFSSFRLKADFTLSGLLLDGCSFVDVEFAVEVFDRCKLRGTSFAADARPNNTAFTHCTFDAQTSFPEMQGTGNAFRSGDLTDLFMPYYDARHWFFACSCTLPSSITHDERQELRKEQPVTGDFYYDWRAWQRTIGFQPDENQQ